MNVITESLYSLMLACIYLFISSLLLLLTYSLLASLYWSIVSCFERWRDYLDGKGNKS